MHAPFTFRSTLGEIKTATRGRKRERGWFLATVVIVAVAIAAYFERGPLQAWLFGPSVATTI